jgi:AcrR family transcriptional regulator
MTSGDVVLTRLTPAESRRRSRELVIDAAMQVVAPEGDAGTSVDAIAVQAGFPMGAVYSNFATKEELFLAAFERHCTGELAALAAGGRGPSQPGPGAGRGGRSVRRPRRGATDTPTRGSAPRSSIGSPFDRNIIETTACPPTSPTPAPSAPRRLIGGANGRRLGPVEIRETVMPQSMPGAEAAVELLHLDGSPKHKAFLPHPQRLLTDAGIDAPARLVSVPTDEDPQRLRLLGSPNLRVNGHDVDPAGPGRSNDGLRHRIDTTSAGLPGTPSDGWSRAAVRSARSAV